MTISDEHFTTFLKNLAKMQFQMHPVAPLLMRMRELAPNMTAYDAAYAALAEHLGVPLVTRDAKHGRTPGIRAEIRLVGAA